MLTTNADADDSAFKLLGQDPMQPASQVNLETFVYPYFLYLHTVFLSLYFNRNTNSIANFPNFHSSSDLIKSPFHERQMNAQEL